MDSGRLQRGRSYAAAHRRKAFSLKLGTANATMVGNVNPYFGVYKTPYYKVSIRFTRIPASKWAPILKRIGTSAEWVTYLIIGEVPPSIDRAFKAAPVGLLPRKSDEIEATCSCPDWVRPCKHVAGVYYHIASLLDRDPLLLFELRGLERATLLQAVEQSEFGKALREETAAKEPVLEDCLGESPQAPVQENPISMAPSDLRSFWRGRPLPARGGTDDRDPPISALVLRREGDYPEFWHRGTSFLDAMSGFYERVAKSLPNKRDPYG